jgi:hypothetical protein
MSEALSHLIIEELENPRLKKRIREIEVSFTPKPLFVKPLSMIVPHDFPKKVTRSSSKVSRVAKMMMVVR